MPLATGASARACSRRRVRIELEPRAPDRDAVARAVAGDDVLLRHARAQVDGVMRAAVARAALVGARRRRCVGGLLALLAWERLGVRGRELALAPLVIGGDRRRAALRRRGLGRRELRRRAASSTRRTSPPGEELDRLLAQADELRDFGPALQRPGPERARRDPRARERRRGSRRGAQQRAVLASDLHANALALPVLRRYAHGLPLFMPGDFSVNGARLESDLLRGIESAGDPVVMTSGNHDSDALMRSFARRGAIVLTHAGRLERRRRRRRPAVRRVAGLDVAGFEDPLAYRGRGYPVGVRATLSFTDLPDGEQRFTRGRRPLLGVVERAAAPPRRAADPSGGAGARSRGADRGRRPAGRAAGDPHRPHAPPARRPDRPGDGHRRGSVGAGGPFGAGKDDIGLAILAFGRASHGRLRSADLASIDPRNGAAQAERVVVDSPDCERPSSCTARRRRSGRTLRVRAAYL